MLYAACLQVAGDGVVGKHPLLQPGQPEFVYQSCTYTPNLPPESPAAATSSSVQSSSGADAGSSSTASNAPADLGRVTGSMGGSFEFVPGSMEEPTGPAWDVLCPDFDLALPHYVY